MPARLQIDCVSKDERLNPYARIVRISGPNLPGVPPPDASRVATILRKRGVAVKEGARWTLEIEDAIQGVLNGTWTFFIALGSFEEANVQVATSPSGQLYLKTDVDHDTPDELLFLPECR